MTPTDLSGPIPSSDAWVDISRVDLSDFTYIFTFKPEIDNLTDSIKRINLTHHPLLQRKKGGFRLVTGYRRILALKQMGAKGLLAKIVKEEVSGLKLFLFNLYENLGTRWLNDVEKATVLEKLINQFGLPRSKVRDEFLPHLGLGKNEKVLDLYLDLAGMEEAVKEEVAGGRFSLEAVKLLAQIPKSERKKVFPWVKGLRLGKNKQKEFLILLGDLAKIKGSGPTAILEKDTKIKEIMAREDWPLPVKAQKIEEYFKGERYPLYRRAEEEYKKSIKELQLPLNLSLKPPQYFEGEEYEVRFTFRKKADFQSAVHYLNRLCEGKTLEELLSIP